MSTIDSGGGEGDKDKDSPDFLNLQENFNKQQVKIEALKELVRQTEATQGKNTANAQEKVRNIALRLTHLKAKASRSRQATDPSNITEEIIFENVSVPSTVNVPLTTTVTTTTISSSDDDDQKLQHEVYIPKTPISITVPHQQIQKARSETPGSEKIQLLRIQMEQNRLKMAEREHTKRGIEELVTQLKAKFDDNQMSLEKSSHLGRSIGDLSLINRSTSLSHFRERNKSVSDFTTTAATTTTFGINNNTNNFEKERNKFLERRIKELEIDIKLKDQNFLNKNPDSEHLKIIKNLENKILDLEESVKEKQCIIDARTQAVGLMTENLSLKGKSTIDMLEVTKDEMKKMQENFIQNENDFQLDMERLKMELNEKNNKIKNMEEINDILETARFDLTIENAELRSKIDNVQDYNIKLNEMSKINESLQHRILNLESDDISTEKDIDIDAQENIRLTKEVNIEQLLQIQSLQNEIEQLKLENCELKKSNDESTIEKQEPLTIIEPDVQQQLKNLEKIIAEQKQTIDNHLQTISQLEDNVTEKTIEYNVLLANFNVLQENFTANVTPKPLFSMATDENAEQEITKLKTKLDESNKNMIKMKLKSKQLQKQIDTLKKSSDINQELVKRTEENQQLQQKLLDYADEKKRLENQNQNDIELGQKIQVLETMCQNQNSAIQLLEEQKIDITDNLNIAKSELLTLKDRIKDYDNEETIVTVRKHMDSIEMEETIDKQTTENDELRMENKKLLNENKDLQKRLDRHVAENIELLDKIEKLNKGSSAESIEIVEAFTQQEKFEMEQFQQLSLNPKSKSEGDKSDQEDHHRIDDVPHFVNTNNNQLKNVTTDSVIDGNQSEIINDNKDNNSNNDNTKNNSNNDNNNNNNDNDDDDDDDDKDNDNDNHDLSDSLIKLREESSKLMNKIKLFTDERNEVLDKIDILNTENHQYVKQIAELNAVKKEQEEEYIILEQEKFNALAHSKVVESEKQELLETIREINETKVKLKEEINKLIKERNEAKATTVDIPIIKLSNANYSKSLRNLEKELDNYRKTKDRNSKFGACKKLVKEAENIHEIMVNLLTDIDKVEHQINELKSVEKVCCVVDEDVVDNNCNQMIKVDDEIIINLKLEMEKYKEKLIESENVESVLKAEIETLSNEISYQEKLNKMNVQKQREAKFAENNINVTAKNELEHENERLHNKLTTLNEQYDTLVILFDRQSIDLKELRKEYDNHIELTTNEINILKTLVSEQKQQLIESITEHETELTGKFDEITKLENHIKQLTNEMSSIKNDKQNSNDKYVATLLEKIESLKCIFDQNNDLIDQQATELQNKQDTIDALNKQIMDLYKSMESNSEELYETQNNIEKMENIIKLNEHEINELKLNKNANTIEIQRLTNVINEKMKEIEKIQNTNKINKTIFDDDVTKDLENNNLNLEKKNKEQLEKLKKFAINLKKKNAQCLELEEKLRTFENENKKLIEYEKLQNELTAKIAQFDNLQLNYINLQAEMNVLKHENNKFNNTLQQQSIVESAENLKHSFEMELQQFNTKIGNQAKQITELNGENKNLQIELTEKLQLIDTQTNDLQSIQKQLNDSEVNNKQKIEKCKQILREKNKEIKKLQEIINQSNDIKKSMTVSTSPPPPINLQSQTLQSESETKIIESQEIISKLVSKIDTIEKANDGKLQENLLVIETLQLENLNLIEKLSKLEETNCTIEKQRTTLEYDVANLNDKLQDKTNEINDQQNEFQERLNNLLDQNKINNEKLIKCQLENDELTNELQESVINIKQHQQQIQNLDHELKQLKETKLDELEKDNFKLLNDNKSLQTELQRSQTDLNKFQKINQKEFQQLEYDMSVQLQKLNDERKMQQENIEKLNEKIAEHNDEIKHLKEFNATLEHENQILKLDMDNINYDQNEMSNLRMQIIHDQTEIDNLKTQNLSIVQNHDLELQALRQQITELDTLRMQVGQNQTDDQVFIQNENQRLQLVLAEKEHELEMFKQQINQQQPPPPPPPPPPPNNLISVSVATEPIEIATMSTATTDLHEQSTDKINELQQNVNQLELLITNLKIENANLFKSLNDKEQLNNNNNNNNNNNINNYDDDMLKNLESFIIPSNESTNQSHDTNIPSFDSSIFFDSNTNSIFDQAIPLQQQQKQHAPAPVQQQQLPPHQVQQQQLLQSPQTTTDLQPIDESKLQPVIEEIIVPKKAYICHPEKEEDDAMITINKNELNELRNHIQILDLHLVNANKDIENYNINNIECESVRKQLENQLKEINQNVFERDNEIKKLNNQLVGMSCELDEQKELINSKSVFEQKNVELNIKITELEKYIFDLENKLKNIIDTNNDCLKQLHDKCEIINEFQTKVKEYDEKIINLEIQLRQFEDERTLKSVEQFIIPSSINETQTSVNIEQLQSTENIPSFNSSVFFNKDTTAPATDLSFDQPQQPPKDQPQSPSVDFPEDPYKNRVPIVEEIIVPKKAYVCQPNIVDEGWEWDSNEAILEEQHQQKVAPTNTTASLIPTTSHANLEIKLQESDDKIQVLELERDRLREETIALKVKCGKILKKLKEYQQQQQQFKKSPSMDSNDLDLAIQDELNNQIKVLETKLNEMKCQQDKERNEKLNLQKRIDVLSQANEHMLEMKERQDIELEINHTKIKELTLKLKQLDDWNNHDNPIVTETISTTISSKLNDEQLQQQQPQNNYADLQKHINDLSADNEEFQALLEDEKSMNKLLEEKLKQLQQTLLLKNDVELNYEQSLDKIKKIENNNSLLKYAVQEREEEIENLKCKLLKSEQQISTIVELSNESNLIKLNLNQLKNEHTDKINENSNLLKEHKLLSDKNLELSNEIDRLKLLQDRQQQQQDQQQSSSSEFQHQQTAQQQEQYELIQELLAQIQYKESEILHLNQRIIDVQQKDQTESLILEILLKNQEIEQLKLKIEQHTVADNNLKTDNKIEDVNELNEKLIEYENYNKELLNDKESMEKELQVLNEQVLLSFELEDKIKKAALELDMKNIEINELKNSLQQQQQRYFSDVSVNKTNDLNENEILKYQQQIEQLQNDALIKDHSLQATIDQLNADWEQIVLKRCSEITENYQQQIEQLQNDIIMKDQNLQTTIDQINANWEQIVLERCSEVANIWREHLNVVEQERQNINIFNDDSQNNNNNVSGNSADETKQSLVKDEEMQNEYVKNLQTALENQEIEIVTLKEQLAIRSAEYARIAAHIDPFRQMSTSNNNKITLLTNVSGIDLAATTTTNNNGGGGLKQKFDFALYVLHQTDMRCQELTEEVKKLLEERDTLQLKLSNAIRMIEDSKIVSSNVTTPATPMSVATQSSNKDDNNHENLTAKLSQLHSVNHLRDKRFIEEREQRERHMSMLQQDCENMPQEAIAELIGADYTISRTSQQSSSSTLLNWFWGTSTPKSTFSSSSSSSASASSYQQQQQQQQPN